MAQIKENIELEVMDKEFYRESTDDIFHQVPFDEAKKFDDYLKLELIYYGQYSIEYEVTNLTRKYIKKYGNSILESHCEEKDDKKYVINLYYLDKSITNSKDKLYLYDKYVNMVYKVPITGIGSHKVHSIEELEYQRSHGNESKEVSLENVIQQDTSQIVTNGETAYYSPELKGFAQDKTSAVYYKTNLDGTITEEEELVPMTTYLASPRATIEKNSETYTFHNYQKQIWANIKVEGSGVVTYWT